MTKLTAKAETKVEERALVAQYRAAGGNLSSEARDFARRGRGGLCIRLLFVFVPRTIISCFYFFVPILTHHPGDGSEGDCGVYLVVLLLPFSSMAIPFSFLAIEVHGAPFWFYMLLRHGCQTW